MCSRSTLYIRSIDRTRLSYTLAGGDPLPHFHTVSNHVGFRVATQYMGGSRGGGSLGSNEPPFFLIHSIYWFFVTRSSVLRSALAYQSSLATV